MGDIANEEKQVAQEESIRQQQAGLDRAKQDEIDINEAAEEGRRKTQVAKFGLEEGADISKRTAEEAKAEADFGRRKEEITALTDGRMREKDAEMQAKGEVVGSPEYITRKRDDIIATRQGLMDQHKISESTAEREATVMVLRSAAQAMANLPPELQTALVEKLKGMVSEQFEGDMATEVFGEIMAGVGSVAGATPSADTAPADTNTPATNTPATNAPATQEKGVVDLDGDGIKETMSQINKARDAVDRVPRDKAEGAYRAGTWNRDQYDRYLKAEKIAKAWDAQQTKEAKDIVSRVTDIGEGLDTGRVNAPTLPDLHRHGYTAKSSTGFPWEFTRPPLTMPNLLDDRALGRNAPRF